ncbi:metal-sensitive transcriptional regulator [Corynebacterium pseudodiphtheriticum]|uniref:metal-sensitive transcriptional regulator n=1 Tax=Corynebacterium pseudodiphtheriticum TaxID=37637 RepID=UPI00254B564B|nr:metal-sensitive transcriptional regulator [Corynebacterium pseudodiphtheriticum]MDK8546635.1 metal-sensitive transcriptional regulator [Corynebacterium pseudodiphtheriticum]
MSAADTPQKLTKTLAKTMDTQNAHQPPEHTDDPCPCTHHEHGYSADKSRYLSRLRRIEGQTRGIQRMIDEDRYCIDIITQISAITSALENISLDLLNDHIHSCVADAATQSGPQAEATLDEAMKAIRKIVKS